MNKILPDLFLLVFIACSKSEEFDIQLEDEIIGSWVNPAYNDSTITYEKANSLKENDYGFQFKTEHQFVERKNSGWCGTPPIAYADFDGTWTRNDSIIQIEVAYWGGTVDLKMKIIALDQKNLTILKIKEAYHLEED